MPHATQVLPALPARPRRRSARANAGSPLRATLLALAAGAFSADGLALDYGPFSLNGFAKVEAQRVSNYCPDCSLFPDENKQRAWADPLQYGKEYGTETVTLTLFQPYLGVKFDLGGGFKLSGLLSQRWRDGEEDIPGFWYDKNIALSHEDYGSLRIGAMTTRGWSVADYPYGTYLNVADQWASSGAGYGLLTRAIRYTSRTFDVLEGDLVLEATYDIGESGWSKNKPWFVELYAQYHRGDLVVDAMVQDSRNGTPSAWGHGPFTGLTPFPADDAKLGSSGQSIAMAMARYDIDARWQVGGGIRFNRWSGAYARITKSTPGQADQWNNMFNVDWWCKSAVPARCDIDNPGYAARSTDILLGLRYRTGKWIASTGMVYLGEAKTDNPSERGQSNSALYNTVGLNYEYGHGLQFYGFAGRVQYQRLGLSPMSMPGNSSFSGVDSRVSKDGNWFGAGAIFVF
jgi:predicted porin